MTARYETIEAGRAEHAIARRIACGLVLSLGFVGLLFLPRNAVAAGEQACVNESLRSALGSGFLPDCRAYEKVSPDYKEGYTLLVESLASDGNSAVVHSFATLAGNPGSSEKVETGSVYLDTRTASGWTLTPMNASLSEFIGQDMLAAEADRGLSLWMQHTPDEGPFNRGLYVRLPTGHFSFIGPASPSSSAEEEAGDVIDLNKGDIDLVRAATADYGHLLLQAEFPAGRWPFDETDMEGAGRTSLYEYSGAENIEPTLVGVLGARGSRHLIALCGTAMGAGSRGSSFNALSSDGETVFFTVNPCNPGSATAEVYARLHGSVNGVGAAETVNVSENECTTACGAESGKNFEGASEDGRRAFFTSTQKLTDDAVDAAASGNAAEERGCASIKQPAPPQVGGCNLYQYDFAQPVGKRLKVVSVGAEVLGVTGIAENGSHVYYVSRAAVGSGGVNVYNALPVVGQPNMYMYDAVSGRTVFVATLGSGDGEDWLRSFTRPAQVAGVSGRFLLFVSSKPGLTTPADDTSSMAQLFEYKAPGEGKGGGEGEAAELVRVTKGEDGFNQDGNGVSAGVLGPQFASRNSVLGSRLDFKTTTTHLNISADGQTVIFLTAGQLSQRATSAMRPECESLYEFQADGEPSDGSVHLLSDGGDTHLYKGLCGVLFQGIDATGANVLLSTGDPLLSGDADGGQFDTYDARIGGGFPPPSETGICDTGFCEAAPSVPGIPPALPVAGSAWGSGEAPALAPHTGGGKDKRLAPALRACRAKPRARRARCERAARRRFGSKARQSGSRRRN